MDPSVAALATKIPHAVVRVSNSHDRPYLAEEERPDIKKLGGGGYYLCITVLDWL